MTHVEKPIPNINSLIHLSHKEKLPTSSPNRIDQPPTANTGRSPGDYRSAEQITAHPQFKKFLEKFEGDQDLLTDFKFQVGGDWNDKNLNPRDRADCAANAYRVLKHIDRTGPADTKINGDIDGFKTVYSTIFNPQKQHFTDVGSEAWKLVDFSQRGYLALTHPDIHNQHYHRSHHPDTEPRKDGYNYIEEHSHNPKIHPPATPATRLK